MRWYSLKGGGGSLKDYGTALKGDEEALNKVTSDGEALKGDGCVFKGEEKALKATESHSRVTKKSKWRQRNVEGQWKGVKRRRKRSMEIHQRVIERR